MLIGLHLATHYDHMTTAGMNNEGQQSMTVKLEVLQKVSNDYSDLKRQKLDSDSTTCNTMDLYGDNEYHKGLKTPMPTIEEKQQDDRREDEPPMIPAEEEFIPIGAKGKVHWAFTITAVTTDDEIKEQGPGSLTNAVTQVEKMLGNKFQNIESPVGPRELAKLARDSLIKQVD